MNFILLLGFIPLITIASIWRGFVFMKLWAWFIVPVFHLPMLTIVIAIGVSMVVSFLTYHSTNIDRNDTRSSSEKFTTDIAATIMYPATFLFLGWIVQMFL